MLVVVLLVVVFVVVEVVWCVVSLVEPELVVPEVPAVLRAVSLVEPRVLAIGVLPRVVLSLRNPLVQSVAKPNSIISSTITTLAIDTTHLSRLSWRLYLSRRFSLLLSSC